MDGGSQVLGWRRGQCIQCWVTWCRGDCNANLETLLQLCVGELPRREVAHRQEVDALHVRIRQMWRDASDTARCSAIRCGHDVAVKPSQSCGAPRRGSNGGVSHLGCTYLSERSSTRRAHAVVPVRGITPDGGNAMR